MNVALFRSGQTAMICDGLKLHWNGNSVKFQSRGLADNAPEKQPFASSGTAGAISYLRIGGPAFSACIQSQRGGARNRRNRQSEALTSRQVGELIAAAHHADAIGLTLNRMITIHWESAGIEPPDIAWANGRFLDLLGKTIARHGGSAAFLWAQESGDGKGGHCHVLAHVPALIVPITTQRQLGWLRAITGRSYRCRIIHSNPIGARLGLETSNPALHAANLAEALSYVLKGADDPAVANFGLQRQAAGGRCFGKRCGTSQNIGAKARGARK
jgi:hypothetical protein